MSALRSLLILGTLLTASGFGSEFLGDYAGPIEYQGSLTFEYPDGVNPINNIEFTVDGTLSENLLVVNVPAGWSYTCEGNFITLCDGSLSPGGVVNVGVSLNKYHEAGDYELSAVGKTTAGETSNAQGALQVGDLYILQGLDIANTYRLPLAGSTLGLGLLEAFFVSRRSPADSVIDHLTGNPFGANKDANDSVASAVDAANVAVDAAKDSANAVASIRDQTGADTPDYMEQFGKPMMSEPEIDFKPEIIDTSDKVISLEMTEGDIQIKDMGVSKTTKDVTIHPDGHVTSSVEDIITRWPSTPEPTVTFQIGSDSNLTQTIKVEETGKVIKFDWLDQLKIDNPLQEADVSQAIENPKEFFKFEWLSPEDDIIDSIDINDDLMQFRYKVWF